MSKRKAYRLKPVNPHAAFVLITKKHDQVGMLLPLASDQVTDLGLAYRLAFDAMCTGRASEENWSTVVCSLNVGQILCENGIGNEYDAWLVKALDGAFRSKLRAALGNGWGYDDRAMSHIKAALEVHDEQIQCATKEEMRDALMEVRRRIDDGNVYGEAA
jgi:hypothetical protein